MARACVADAPAGSGCIPKRMRTRTIGCFPAAAFPFEVESINDQVTSGGKDASG